MLKHLCMTLALLGMSGCLGDGETPLRFGSPFYAAVRAHGEGRYEDARHLYMIAARDGVLAAHNNLGLLYLNGRGVPRDELRAWDLFRTAAQQGLSFGWFNLAQMIERGEAGQRVDLDRAFSYYQQAFLAAGDDGNSAIYGAMGLYYEYGWVAPRNFPKAVEFYTTGAKLGDQTSIDHLTRLGLRVPKAEPVEQIKP